MRLPTLLLLQQLLGSCADSTAADCRDLATATCMRQFGCLVGEGYNDCLAHVRASCAESPPADISMCLAAIKNQDCMSVEQGLPSSCR